MPSAPSTAEPPAPAARTVATYPERLRFAVSPAAKGLADFSTIDDDTAFNDHDIGDVSVATWNVMDADPVQPGPFLPQFVSLPFFTERAAVLHIWTSTYGHAYRAFPTVSLPSAPTSSQFVVPDYSPADDKGEFPAPVPVPDFATASYRDWVDYHIAIVDDAALTVPIPLTSPGSYYPPEAQTIATLMHFRDAVEGTSCFQLPLWQPR